MAILLAAVPRSTCGDTSVRVLGLVRHDVLLIFLVDIADVVQWQNISFPS
jgi:hypothetical protein